MPMLDAFIPEGALAPDAEARLMRELTDILIRLEGIDPANERAQAAAWIFLRRPTMFVAGQSPTLPRYKFVTSVPEGQYDDAARNAVVHEVTAAVARAEGCGIDEVSARVWVFPTEVPDGTWGGRGEVRRLPDILAGLLGEDQRPVAVAKLANRRRSSARAIVEAAQAAE